MYKTIITTTDSLKIINKISDYLLNKKLSPCIQVLTNLESKYIWEGKIASNKEYLMLIKCKTNNINTISTYIKKNHNYEVCEIIKLDMDILNDKYEKWFNKTSI